MKRAIPVVRQMSQADCGAACLAMILGHHGRQTSLAECQRACGDQGGGITALAIVQAARKFGLRVRSYSLEPASLQQLDLPAIVHWNFNHFVVVERWSPREVTIIDPASGRRQVDAAEFESAFTGVTLTFEAGAGLHHRRAQPSTSLSAYLAAWLRTPGTGSLLAQVLAASVLLQAGTFVVPIVTRILVDHVAPASLSALLPALAAAAAVAVAWLVIGSLLRSMLLVHLQARTEARMMVGFFDHLLGLPCSFFQRRTSGDLLMRLNSNDMIRETLSRDAVASVLDAGIVAASLAALWWVTPRFATIVLVIGAAQVALSLLIQRPLQKLAHAELEASARSQSYALEAVNGIAVLKACGGEDRSLDHWTNLFTSRLHLTLRRDRLGAVLEAARLGLAALTPLAILLLGARDMLAGTISLGTLLALNALAISFLTPLTSLVATIQQLQLLRAHVARLLDVLDTPLEQAPGPHPTPRLQGGVQLAAVSFRYDDDGPWALRDIDLVVKPGQKVALVGRTGSGKSTLARLILGLHQPTEGTLSFDGRAAAALDLRATRAQFGAVLQDVFLFTGSIRQNIAFNDPALSLDDVQQAARLAEIDDDILRMPMGYETRLAEGGANLSGGQRQRIAIARALAHRPALVMLDEATSHLDVITEERVDHRLAQLGMTRIVVAHRLSTIRNADLIVVLDQGRAVERGTHDQLLAFGGQYAALVEAQLAASQPPSGDWYRFDSRHRKGAER